jgi:hypothetical protein
MSEFAAFVQLGFAHITALDAIDHILFLLALAAIYTVKDWSDILWVVTAFTVGHSVTLALAVTGAVRVDSAIVEFLIPLTIVATCIENMIVRARASPSRVRSRPIFAGVFGLVHGAGFAGYLQNAFGDNVGLPLAGFNLGIEAGQIVVLLAVFGFLHLVDGLIARSRTVSSRWPVVRLRSAGVSALIMVVAVRWAVLRSPW